VHIDAVHFSTIAVNRILVVITQL